MKPDTRTLRRLAEIREMFAELSGQHDYEDALARHRPAKSDAERLRRAALRASPAAWARYKSQERAARKAWYARVKAENGALYARRLAHGKRGREAHYAKVKRTPSLLEKRRAAGRKNSKAYRAKMRIDAALRERELTRRRARWKRNAAAINERRRAKHQARKRAA